MATLSLAMRTHQILVHLQKITLSLILHNVSLSQTFHFKLLYPHTPVTHTADVLRGPS
jgi:hypothetical protein